MSALAVHAPIEPREIIHRLLRLLPHEALAAFAGELIEGAIAPRTEPPSDLSSEEPEPAAPAGATWWGSARKPLRARTATARKRKRARTTGRPPGRPRKHPAIPEANGKAMPIESIRPMARAPATPEATAFWTKVEETDPVTPWKLVADKLGLNRAVCQDAHKANTLPQGVTPEAAAAFAF